MSPQWSELIPWNNVAPDCWLSVGPAVACCELGSFWTSIAGQWRAVLRGVWCTAMLGVLKLVLSSVSFLVLFSAGPCCHLPLSLWPLSLVLPDDRGAVGAAGVRDACQQGDHVSSEPVPCLYHCHVDWQPASADYRQCGSKRNPLWQWQAYDLQDMLI